MKIVSTFILCFLLLSEVSGQCTYTIISNPGYGKETYVFDLPCNSSYALSTGYCDSTNFGDKDVVLASSWTYQGTQGNTISYMEFDLRSIINNGCQIESAQLILNHNMNTAQPNSGNNDFIINRVSQPWDEHALNWSNQPDYYNMVAGKDYLNVPASTLSYQTYSIDITEMAKEWYQKPDSNFGFRMALNDPTVYKRVSFATGDHADINLRPRIEIKLSCPNSCKNLIKGNIYEDLDLSCSKSAGDVNLANWIVKIEPGPMYVNTDTQGNYEVWVDIGTYMINAVSQSALWDLSCNQLRTATFSSQGDTVSGMDFAVQSDKQCSVLRVDVGAGRFRSMHTEDIMIQYCNDGNKTESNTYVDVDLGNDLTYLSSSISGTLLSGNIYRFNTGTIVYGTCSSFYITAQVGNVTFGSTVCVEAEIFPHTPCIDSVSNSWDKSSIKVTGSCINDSLVRFVIINHGDDMGGLSEYRIFENNILIQTGTFQLQSGDSLVIIFNGNGNVIRLEADQRPFHPGNSHPRATIENCGSGGNTPLGVNATNAAQDDADIFKDVLCLVVSNSYDPNEKLVNPSGITSENYISKDDELEYLINFQNTGNDTAYIVVLKDRISDMLDLGTIVSGASSHKYTFNVYENRNVEWIFDNINLVDSNTNESGSHGFVKFKIKQLSDNPKGTIINNSASIYFDYNSPVITNTTNNVIYDTLLIPLKIRSVYSSGKPVSVYPNPASMQISVNGIEGIATMRITDLTGRVLKEQLIFGDKQEVINLSEFESGTYILEIIQRNNRQVVKVVKR